MSKKRKWISIVALLGCFLPLLTGIMSFGSKAQAAAADKVSVTLHKKQMDEFPTNYIENTGKEMTAFDRYEGLNDIEFEAFDITETFYSQLDAKLKALSSYPNYTEQEKEVAVKDLMKGSYTFDGTDAKNVSKGKETTATVNGDDGIAKFENLDARDANNQFKVYYFKETPKTGVTEQSQPLILALPALDENGDEISDIHLYPKNKIKNELEKDLLDENGKAKPELTVNDDYYDYEVASPIKYQARFKIPSQIGEILTDDQGEEVATRYSKLNFKDNMSLGFVKFNEIEKVTIGGVDVPLADLLAHGIISYVNKDSVTAANAGFEIAMNFNAAKKADDPTGFAKSKATAEYLAQFAGKTIEFTYSVSLTDQTPVDEAIENEFSVTIRRDGDSDDETNKVNSPKVGTGGRKFIKHATGDTNDRLKGAEFVVIREDGGKEYYLKKDPGTDGKLDWAEVGANETFADAKVLISGDDGSFEISGLKFGDYKLREIKAPNGFQKLGDTDFNVSKGSYKETTSLIHVANPKKGFLPSTGGMGILFFLVVGMALMIAGVVKYRRLSDEAV